MKITVEKNDKYYNLKIPLNALVSNFAKEYHKKDYENYKILEETIEEFNNAPKYIQLLRLNARKDTPEFFCKWNNISNKLFNKGDAASLKHSTHLSNMYGNATTSYYFKLDEGIRFFAELKIESDDKILTLSPVISVIKEYIIEHSTNSFGKTEYEDISEHSGDISLKNFYDNEGRFNISKNKLADGWISRNILNTDKNPTLRIGDQYYSNIRRH